MNSTNTGYDETFTLAENEREPFYRMLDAVHLAISERGCFHPKFKPSQCALVTRDLWKQGIRPEARR